LATEAEARSVKHIQVSIEIPLALVAVFLVRGVLHLL